MKRFVALTLCFTCLTVVPASRAVDFKQSKVTQVVNDVQIISAADQAKKAAVVNDIFAMPDILRTGAASRAELVAEDDTITRVGANTIFSFDPASRTIDLQQGSLLFHSPKGKGGGTIRTGSATASVIGTTIIITATPNGGFKLLDLEGQAEVRFLNGINQTLEPGQMTFILPSGQTSPILVFRLDSETKGSTLVSGFTTPLDSQSKINSEITQQLLQILNGTAADTGLIVGNNATPTTVQTVQGYYNSQQSPTPPPSGFAGDGSIVGEDHVSTLPVNYAPLDPNHLQNTSFTPPTGIDSISQGLLFLGIFTPASGFIGNNIDIDTGKVDLSSFKGAPDFDIVAKGNMKIWQSVNFDKVTPPTPSPTETSEPQLPDVVSLIAGGQMLIASGSTLEADTGTFGLVADSFGVLDTDTGLVGVGGQNTLEDVSLINNAGGVDVLSLSDFTFASGSINGGSDGSESTGGEVEIQSDGTLTLGSESTVSLAYLSRYNFTIDSGANVKLLSTGQMDILDSQIDSTTGNMEADAGGAIYINGSYLYANSEDSLGGNVTIDGAGVQIFGTYIYGYGGNVDITSAGAAVDIDSSEINAAGYILPGLLANTTPTIVGGVVNITGGGDVGIYDHSTIDAGGNVNITSGDASSGGGDLNIESSTVYAGYDSSFGGSVDLNAENGAVYISGSHLSANEAYSVGGNVTIAGDGVQIYSTTIYGAGGVDIASSGMLSVGTDPAFDVTITAGSEATLSAAGAVDMTDTGITAGDDVSITSQHGGVDIYGSDIYADYGAVSINAGGNMYLSSSGIESGYYTSTAYDVDINAGGTIDLEDTYVYATGAVNIESGNALTLGQSSSDEIVAGGLIELKSDKSDVNVDYDLYAGGDVDITSGSVVVSDYIGTVVGGNIQVESSDIEAGDSDYASTGGNVNINAINGTVDIDNSYISANGHIFPGTVADTTPSFVGGDVTISGSGTVGIYNDSTIDAAADANITSTDGGDVNVESSYVYGGDSDFGGSVTVNAEDGDVLITGSTLSASDDVTVTGGGGVTISGSTITVNNGLVNIESGGNLTVGMNPVSESLVASYDTTITAGTEATLTGAGEVDITDTGITAADDVSITSDGTASFVSPGNLSISESYTADNINISGSSITSDNGDVSIVNSGGFSVSGTTVSISDSDISFDNISISDSTITADNGGVLIEYDGQLNRSDSISFTISGSTLNANDIFISGSSITANNGDVDIWNYKNEDNTGPDSVTEDSDVYTSDISITSESTITANNGNVDIKTQNGGIDLENSTVYADDCIRLCADAGVTIYNDTITSGEGVKIHSKSDSNNSFDGNMYLTGDTITAGTDATISGDGNVAITDSTITANGGDVMVSADDGMLTINADHDFSVVTADSIDEVIYDIEASSDVSLGGDCVSIKDTAIQGGDEVDITGTDGNVKVIDADIETGNGDIDMTAYNGTLTLDSGNADYGVYIEAGGAVNLSADYDVDIYDSTIYADNGDVDITSQGTTTVTLENAAVGTIDIENTDIYAGQDSTVGGSVNINAYNGDVYLSGDDIEAYAGVVPDLVSISDGDMTIYGSGTVDVENSYVSADGTVSFTSGGMLTINADHDFSEDYYEDISAGGDVTLDGGTCAKVMDTVIYAYGGVTLTGEDGNVKVIDADIETGNGDIDMTAYNGTLTLDSGNADYGVYIEAGGAVNLSADYDVDIYDSTIYADNGDVDITSQGTTTVILENAAVGSIDIENTDIYAGQESTVGGSVNINAYNGDVYLSGDDIEAYAGVVPDLISISDGDVTIYGSGTVDVKNSYVSADGTVSVTSGGMLTINADHDFSDEYYEDISAGGDVTLDGGTCAKVVDTVIYADGGVTLTGEDGNVKVIDADIETLNGDIDMTAYRGTLTLDSGSWDYGVYIKAGGAVNLSADYDVCISDSGIIAQNGDVTIASGGALDSTDENAGGSVYIRDGSLVEAANGDVKITASGTSEDVTVDDSTIEANGSVKVWATGDMTIEDGSVISATVGNAPDENAASKDEVKLASEGELTVDGDFGNENFDYDIGADHKVTLWSGEGVSVDGALIKTLDGSSCDEIKLASSGEIDITDGSELDSYGKVKVDSYDGGDVKILDSQIIANGGDVTVSADDGMLTINGNYVYPTVTPDAISSPITYQISAEGTASLSGDCVSIKDTTIYAGDEVDITGTDGNVKIKDADIVTDSGNVNVKADYGSLTLKYGCADYGVNINSAGSVSLTADDNVDIYGNDSEDQISINANDGGATITSYGGSVDAEDADIWASGNVCISSQGTVSVATLDSSSVGNVDISSSEVESSDSLYVKANGNVGINYSELTADDGIVKISAGRTLSIENSGETISGNSVKLTGGRGVSISDANITADDGDVTIDAKSVDIKSHSLGHTGNIVPADVSIYAFSGDFGDDGSVDIGSIDISAGSGDLSSPSEVTLGDIDISGEGTVSLEGDGTTLEASGSVNVSAGTDLYASDINLIADTGDVDLYDNVGNVDLENSHITATLGNVEIEAGFTDPLGSETLTLNGVIINAAEAVTLKAQGYIDIDIDDNDTGISGASVNLESYDGNVNVGVNPGLDASDSPNLTANNGDVDIYADNGNVDVENSTITATLGNVNIGAGISDSEGSETLILNNDTISTGDVDANVDYTISEYGDVSSSGGNLSISAEGSVSIVGSQINLNGNISISDSGIHSSDTGDLTISTGGSFTISGGSLDLDSSTLSGNNISISDRSYLQTSGGDVDIYNHGSFSSSFGGDVTIEDGSNVNVNNISISGGSTIEADGGNVNIVSDGSFSIYNGGTDSISDSSSTINTIYISGSDIYAYSSSSGSVGGNVEISAGGDVDVESSDIYADKDVSIESTGGTLTLGEGENAGDTFDAGGNIYLTSDNFDVDINNDTQLYAFGGGIDISATAGNVDIENSHLYASSDNNVDISSDTKISATGNVCIGADGGNVQIAADDTVIRPLGGDISIPDVGNLAINDTSIDMGGNVSICGSDITAGSGEGGSGDVDIDARGSLSISGYDVSIAGSDISGSDIAIKNSTITSYNGDVNIRDCDNFSISSGDLAILSGDTFSAGNIAICGDTITANDGSINITSDGDVNLPRQTVSPDVSPNEVPLDEISVNDISIKNSTLDAIGGSVTISASGDVLVSDSSISANAPSLAGLSSPSPDTASINADGTLTLEYGSFDTGVSINSAGEVSLTAGGDVGIYGNDAEDLISIIAHSGDMDIYGNNGSVDVEYSTISATTGNVNIEAGYDDFAYDYDNETLTLNGDTINAGGSVTLSAPGGVGILNVSTVGMTVDDVDITAGSISMLTHYHAIDLDLNDFGSSTLTASSGDVDIDADNGDVDVQGSTIKATLGKVNIGAGYTDIYNYNTELLTLNSVTIKAGEAATLTSSGGIHVDNSGITAASSITLETLYGAANLDANYFGSSTLTATTGDADIYADNGNVDVEGSTIKATHGNVNIGAGFKDDSDNNSETLALDGASITAGKSVTVSSSGTASLTGGSITGNNNVNVNAGSGITINGTAITADDTTYGNITLTSTAGQTTIQNGASMTAYTLTVNSPDGILIDGTSGGTISGNTMNLTAGNNPGQEININQEDFSKFVSISIAAYTVWIQNTDLGYGSVNLGSNSGNINVNTGYHVRDINLDNDKWGGSEITDPSQVSSGYSSSPGVHGYAN